MLRSTEISFSKAPQLLRELLHLWHQHYIPILMFSLIEELTEEVLFIYMLIFIFGLLFLFCVFLSIQKTYIWIPKEFLDL